MLSFPYVKATAEQLPAPGYSELQRMEPSPGPCVKYSKSSTSHMVLEMVQTGDARCLRCYKWLCILSRGKDALTLQRRPRGRGSLQC